MRTDRALAKACRNLRRRAVSFLIPAHNEAATIKAVLEAVDALPFDRQVVVDDDGSTDDTVAIVDPWAEGRDKFLVLRQPNGGKGAAVRSAIPHADGDVRARPAAPARSAV